MADLNPTRPLDSTTTVDEVKGIFCSDIIIINALRLGIKDLRDNPWQLNLCFASLKDDPYTVDLYGQKELDKAKKWFLSTEVSVTMDPNLENATYPRIVVSLMSSDEAEVTLGDVHYVPTQVVQAESEAITDKFNCSYDYTTGTVTLQDPVLVSLSDFMDLVLGSGASYPILQVNSSTSFDIQPGLQDSFTGCVIKMRGGRLIASLESAHFKEAYRVACLAQGDPNPALWLHAIVSYVLLRYRKRLLEGRGFEQSTISSKIFQKIENVSGVENLFGRYIDISGYVRNYWVSEVSERVGYASFDLVTDTTGLKVSQVGMSPTTFIPEPQPEPNYASGIGMTVDDL